VGVGLATFSLAQRDNQHLSKAHNIVHQAVILRIASADVIIQRNTTRVSFSCTV
jgi:hypothetical protein